MKNYAHRGPSFPTRSGIPVYGVLTYTTKRIFYHRRHCISNCCNPQSNIRNPKRYPIIGIPDLLSHRSGMTVKKCFVAYEKPRPSWTVIPDPIGNPRLRSTYLYNEENFL
jgi:hypothetical protein